MTMIYRLVLLPSVHSERKKLPGAIRQRIKGIIDELATSPRPRNSKQLKFSEQITWEIRRIRVDNWRVLYAIDNEFQLLIVLAIRKRPPYNYQDLSELIDQLPEA